MQKSENKIKPMYFWSDGYSEDSTKDFFKKEIEEEKERLSKEDEDLDDGLNFLFENERKLTKRQLKRRRLRNFLKAKAEIERRHWRNASKYARRMFFKLMFK